MTQSESKELWNKVIAVLEDQLQYGFLEQARSVINTQLEDATLILEVDDQDAFEFFSSAINQQRILIVSRQISEIKAVRVNKVEAEEK